MITSEGNIYLRGNTWWCFYSVDHKQRRHSLEIGGGGKNQPAAERAFRRLKEKLQGETTYIPTTGKHITVNQLLDELLIKLKTLGRRSIGKTELHLVAVRKMFGTRRATSIQTTDLETAQVIWTEAGKKPQTVNHRIRTLIQAYRLAARRTPPRIAMVPIVAHLTVKNARQGFVGADEAQLILRNLPDPDVRDFVEWLWRTATRPNEARQLTWDMYDREDATLTIPASVAKTPEPRTIPIEAELADILKRRQGRRIVGNPLIFHRRGRGGNKQQGGQSGQPILDFRMQWRAALKTAGLPARRFIPYDLRRSAIRNIIRSGITQSVTKKISGHLTDATFNRYNITDKADIADAIRRSSAYIKRQLGDIPKD